MDYTENKDDSVSDRLFPKKCTPSGEWISNRWASLSPENFHDLFDNKIPLIRFPAFRQIDQLQALAQHCLGVFMDPIKGEGDRGSVEFAEKPVYAIGVSQFQYQTQGLDSYLSAAHESYKKTDEIYSTAFNPLPTLISQLSQSICGPLKIATESDGSTYFFGIIGLINHGLYLHADFAPYQAPGFIISEIDAQIAVNLYISSPNSGGDTVIYNKPWIIENKLSDLGEINYPLPKSMVQGTRSLSFHPFPGEVCLFNSRNPHCVTPSNVGNRISISFFIGRTKQGKFIIWS